MTSKFIAGIIREAVTGRSSLPPSQPGHVHRRVFTDSVNYFLGKIVPGVMGLCSVLVFVRLLGYDQYGRYAIVFAMAMAIASGMAAWLSQGILRYKSRYGSPSEANIFRHAIISGTLASTGFCAIAVTVAMLHSSTTRNAWVIVGCVGLAGAILIYAVLMAWFQAALQSRRVLIFEVIRSVLCFVFPLAIVWVTGQKSYVALLFGVFAGYLAPTLFWSIGAGLLRSTPKSLPVRTDRLTRRLLADIWNFAWPVALLTVCMNGLVVSDRYFIQKYCAFADAGIYASMYDVVVRSLSLVFAPVALAIHPIIMTEWNLGQRQSAIGVLRLAIRYQMLLFVPILLVVWPLAPWFTRMVLGQPNKVAAGMVLPLALGGFLWQVAGVAHKPLEIMCKTRRMLVGISVALLTNVVGNALLVPRIGYRASAFVSVGASLSYLLMLLILTPVGDFRRETSLQPADAPAESVASGAVLN